MEIPDQLEQLRMAQDAARQMFETLGADCNEHLAAINSKSDQLHHRAYVRAVFAFVEGVIHWQKMSTINLGFLFGKVTLHELVALEGINLRVTKEGDVESYSDFPKFLNNIKFSFKVYSKSIDSDFKLELGGVGWQSLGEAVKIRDRLMHPKEPSQLIVTHNEIATTQEAFHWFSTSYTLCSLYAQKAMCEKSEDKSDLQSINQKIQQLKTTLK
jgi:hypothetical protein